MAPTTIAATDVRAVDIAGDAVQRGFQRAAFYAMGRHWVFYIREGVIPVLVFESSVGESGVWSGDTAFGVALTDGAEFSLTLQVVSPTQAFVHLAWADATGANPLEYARGTLAAAGTIAWDAVQTVVGLEAGWEFENIGICLSMGVAPLLHIVYTRVNIADPTLCTPWLTLSVTVNGTWTQGAGYPMELTAVDDPGWIPLVTPYGGEVLVVYSAQNVNIFSRLLGGAVLWPEVDTGVGMGVDAGRMSIVSRRITVGGTFWADAAFLAYQGADWDLYCMEYNAGWQAPVRIYAIANFREANPLLSIMYYGDEDSVADHGPGTLYCFWTPTTAIPTAEWVTYLLSRDANTTWTNEAGGVGAVEWIDETASGFEVQQSGSVYAFNSEDYPNDLARSYIGIVYVTHTIPPTLRHAALGFDDPTEDLACAFNVNHDSTLDLLGEFVVRHSSDEDVEGQLFAKFEVRITDASEELPAEFIVAAGSGDLPGELIVQQAGAAQILGGFFRGADANEELLGEFAVRRSANQELPAELIVRPTASADLLGEFVVRRSDAEELLGEFIVRHSDLGDLGAEFEISRDDWISQGLNVSVYRDLGVVS